MFIRWLLQWFRTIWASIKNEEADTGAVSLSLHRSPDTPTFEGYEMKKLEINFTGAGTETVKAVFRDANENETTTHGAVVFASSDESIATVTPNDDGITALVTGTGKVGTCTIVATDEKDNASDIATVTTVAGEAVSLDLEEVVTTDSAAPAAPVAAAPAADPVPVSAVTESAPTAADTATTATADTSAAPAADATQAAAPAADAGASTETAAVPAADAPATDPAAAPASDTPAAEPVAAAADQSTGTV